MNSNSYIPEGINEYNGYLEGTRMIGMTDSIDFPEIKMMTSETSGAGVSGTMNTPILGQTESLEQGVKFKTMDSSAIDILKNSDVVNITFRAAQQAQSATGGYKFTGIRIVERGKVKNIKIGKLEKGKAMDVSIEMELSYIYIEVDGEPILELNKIGPVFKLHGKDMLAEIRKLV